MRLNLAVTILAGLVLGWAAAAQADAAPAAPPAAPIFYCPTPGKAAPATAAAPVAPASLHRHHHHGGCPTLRVAAEHHHWGGHAPAPAAVRSNDVSASQAFIYRYERAVHGLQPQAAQQAWAQGNRPPPPGPALAQRDVPPPHCPHGCPGPDAWRHAGPPPMAQQGPPAMTLRAPPPPAAPPRPAPPSPQPERAYAWSDDQNGYGQSGYGYRETERQSERAGGWSYTEENGRGHYAQWGDQFGGQPRRWAGPPRCPPPVPASACTAGQSPPPVYRVAGRDAAGYLTWPGKTPAW